MTTLFLETPDATQALEFYYATTGAVAYDSTTPTKSGGASWECDSGAGDDVASARPLNATSPRRVTVYFRFSDLPGSTVGFLNLGYAVVRITSAGVLQLWDAAGGQLGSDGSTLTTDIWYRICLVSNAAAPTAAKVFLDGNEDISWSGSALSSDIVYIGWQGSPGANKALNFQHAYVDDDTSLADTGDMRVTAKLPGAVNNDNYDDADGTGAVNERPIDEANCKHHDGKTAVLQDYTLETAAAGDVDISGDTYVARCAWMWSVHSKDGDTYFIVDNGDSTSNSWSNQEVATLNSVITDSASYPSNAAGIGQKSGAAAPDDYLYECGTMIAYILAAAGDIFNRSCTVTVSGPSLSLARAGVFARSPSRVGSVTLTLGRVGTFARAPSRVGGVSTSLAKAVTFPRAATRTGGVVLSLARDLTNIRSVTRTGSVSISLARVGTFIRSATRVGGVSVSAAAQVIIVRAATRVGSVVTSLARTLTNLRTITRAGSVSVSATKALTSVKTVTRTGDVSVSVAAQVVILRAASRVGSVSTSLARVVTLLRSATRTGGVATFLARIVAIGRNVTRTGSVSVSAAAQVVILRAVSRVGSVSTAVDAIMTVGRQVTRVGGVATSLARSGVFSRPVTRTGSIVTSAAREVIGEGVEFFVGMYRRIVR